MTSERAKVRTAKMYAADRLFIDAYWWSDGSVSIEGQDLGPNTPTGEEYEYFIHVEASDVPALRSALGCVFDQDVHYELSLQGEAIATHGETRWLNDHGVPFSMQTW